MLQKKQIRFFLALIIMVGTLGCEVVEERSWMPDWTNVGKKKKLPPFNHFRSAELDGQSIRKILIVPFAYKDGPEKISTTITEIFAVELGKAGLFQIMNPSLKPSELIDASNILWDRGVIDVDVLLNAKKKYGVEAVLFGKITNYKPYIPLVLGMKITMISTLSGKTLWSIDGDFDSDQKEVVRFAKSYYKKYYRKDLSLYGWELVLISMERYARFVSNMLISTIKSN
ncbi:MAG: hypothetical protein ACUZ8O_05095 [Candidatus Anammoxibacter sp.]